MSLAGRSPVTLEPRTTLVAAALVTGVASILLALFRRTRQTYPGFGRWTAASALVALGFSLFAMRGLIHDVLSIVVANAAMATASTLRLSGVHQYLGAPPVRRAWWVLPPLAGVTLLLLLLRYGADSFAARTVVSLAAVAAPALATGLAFLRAPAREARQLHRVTGGLFLFLAAAMTLRAASAPHLPASLLAAHAPQTAFFLAASLAESSWNVLFVMLNSSRLEQELRGALQEVRTLSGLLPICSWCRKVRDDGGYWQQLESFLAERAGTQLSHGICPECASGFRAGSLGGRASSTR